MDSNALAVKYLGRALITLVVGVCVCFLALCGYNTYISFSKEKIEVSAQDSNSLKTDE